MNQLVVNGLIVVALVFAAHTLYLFFKLKSSSAYIEKQYAIKTTQMITSIVMSIFLFKPILMYAGTGLHKIVQEKKKTEVERNSFLVAHNHMVKGNFLVELDTTPETI